MTDRPNFRRRRHVARSARILSTGLSATAILGITAAFGATERSQAANADPVPTDAPTAAPQIVSDTSAPSALAPLGTSAHATADTVTRFPSTDGTVTLPAATQSAVAAPAQVQTNAASVAPDTVPATVATTPVDTIAPAPVVTAPAPVDTVAPIAPAEPPVQMTLPPAPSRGSSGGSH